MGNEIRGVCEEAKVGNNLQFFFADMFEQVEVMVKEEFRKAGYGDKPRVATIKNMIKYGLSDFRKLTRSVDYEDQIIFGDSSEKLLKLIVLAIDRAGDDMSIMDEIIGLVEKIDSKSNLNLKKFGIYD